MLQPYPELDPRLYIVFQILGVKAALSLQLCELRPRFVLGVDPHRTDSFGQPSQVQSAGVRNLEQNGPRRLPASLDIVPQCGRFQSALPREAKFSFGYRVWSSSDLNSILIRNSIFLQDYLRNSTGESEDGSQAPIIEFIISHPGASLAELIDQGFEPADLKTFGCEKDPCGH